MQNYLVRKLCYFSVEYHINVLEMCNARRSVVIRLARIIYSSVELKCSKVCGVIHCK